MAAVEQNFFFSHIIVKSFILLQTSEQTNENKFSLKFTATTTMANGMRKEII